MEDLKKQSEQVAEAKAKADSAAAELLKKAKQDDQVAQKKKAIEETEKQLATTKADA